MVSNKFHAFHQPLCLSVCLSLSLFISIYIGRTSQRLEVWKRQHVYSGISNRGRLTSGESHAMDSAIGEHLLAINRCRTNQDDCFSVLFQRSSHTLHILGGGRFKYWCDIVFHNLFFPGHAVVSYFKIKLHLFIILPVIYMNRARRKGPLNFFLYLE